MERAVRARITGTSVSTAQIVAAVVIVGVLAVIVAFWLRKPKPRETVNGEPFTPIIVKPNVDVGTTVMDDGHGGPDITKGKPTA